MQSGTARVRSGASVRSGAKLQLDPSIGFKVNFGQGDARHPDELTVCEDGKALWEIYKFVADVVLPGFLRFFP